MIPLFDRIPVRRFSVVTYALIAANFAVWAWELGQRGDRIDHYAFYPCAVSGPCAGVARDHVAWPEGVVSSMFMHASWLHILGNMLFLWIFGNNVEDVMGRLRFLVFYVAGGFAAALAQTWVTIHYAGTTAASIPNVGASGAIAAVLGAYLVLLPHARIVTLLFGFLPVPISAFIVLGVWFALQLFQANFSVTHPDAGGGVAFAAHVGGFAFGMLAVRAFQVRSPRPMNFQDHVARALDELPPQLAEALKNLAVVVEEEDPDDPDLFGLWEAHEFFPDKITIFRRPLVEAFPDPRELEEEIRITVLHELAHYFGIDEDRLDELGYS